MDILLLQSKMNILSHARRLSYTAILLSQTHIHIKRCTVLNPAILVPLPDDGTPHNCLETTEQVHLPRPDLSDTFLTDGLVWFVNGSCSKTDTGKTQTGYAIVQLPDTIIEANQLTNFHSA